MTCGRHPVCGQLDAFDVANLRGRNVRQRFANSQTRRSSKVEQCDRRTFAQRHRFAIIAIEARGRNRAVRHRDLPRANHLIACHHTGHGTVTDGHQEGFLCHGRQMQNAVYRIGNRHTMQIQRFARRFTGLHVAGHFWRFAQQHVQRQIDRLIVEMRIVHGQVQLFCRFANHRVRRALAAAQLVKQRQLIGSNGHHVAFLRFVTPDFQRAHAWLIAQNIAQIEAATAAAIAHQLWHGVRKTARTDVVDKQNRVGIA
ncbi:hypothetical protein D3C78_779200 [compost metagenome]